MIKRRFLSKRRSVLAINLIWIINDRWKTSGDDYSYEINGIFYGNVEIDHTIDYSNDLTTLDH